MHRDRVECLLPPEAQRVRLRERVIDNDRTRNELSIQDVARDVLELCPFRQRTRVDERPTSDLGAQHPASDPIDGFDPAAGEHETPGPLGHPRTLAGTEAAENVLVSHPVRSGTSPRTPARWSAARTSPAATPWPRAASAGAPRR